MADDPAASGEADKRLMHGTFVLNSFTRA